MVRHGFYQSLNRAAYPHRFLDYMEEQGRDGFSAGALDCAGQLCPTDVPASIALQINGALDAGLAFPGEPLLVQADPGQLYAAHQLATRPWPELVTANIDDPSPEQIHHVIAYTKDAHRSYFRSSMFVHGGLLREAKKNEPEQGLLGETADIWIIQAHTWQHDTEKNAKALGKELWAAYACEATGSYDTMRYLSGLWCWAHKPKQLLVWAYTHTGETMVRPNGAISKPTGDQHSYVIPKCDGTTMKTPGYDGYVAGMQDCRLLEAAENSTDPKVQEYIKFVRGSVPPAMLRPGKTLPALQGDEMRSKLVAKVGG